MISGPTRSLAGRLLLANLVLLPLFLGGTGWFLERSYQRSLESAAEERLQLQVLTLMAEADFEQTLLMPEQLLEARFNQVNSGLFAMVNRVGGDILWTSPSALTTQLQSLRLHEDQIPAGQQAFSRDAQLYRYSWSVLWQTESGVDAPLVFTVLETTAPTAAQLASLRTSLVLWLGGGTIALVLCQMLVLLWGLRPLRELASDIASIEAGDQEKLSGPYPREVQVLTDNLGSLLRVEKQRRERTRNTLSDLAHSLKTPLAVIRNANANSTDYAAQVAEQANHMEHIVSYQLQRAAGGSHNLLRLIPVAATAERLQQSLLKVYAQKSLQIELDIAPDSQFRGDERDLMELLGNLLDNACKYGHQQACVRATGVGAQLQIFVEDDGDGIPAALREGITERGARADSTRPGQGIGLAVALDIANSYGGTLVIDDSDLGGARITVRFDTH